jgi:hypothetical protein
MQNEEQKTLNKLEAIIDTSELDSQDKAVLALRLAAMKLVDINSASIGITLGDYRVEMLITDRGESV